MDHEQVNIKVNHYVHGEVEISVDKGIADIIQRCWHWRFPTTRAFEHGVHGTTWIGFESFTDVQEMMQLALTHQLSINGQGWKQETLFDFLIENPATDHCGFKLDFVEETVPDPNEDDNGIPTGMIHEDVTLSFPTAKLEKFRQLFFECFPEKARKKKTSPDFQEQPPRPFAVIQGGKTYLN